MPVRVRFFFFFQAEDGIRDYKVTGVQTCALPISEAEQVRPPTMSRIVAGLVRAGLVRRGKTEDGRRVRLEATEKGTRILQEGRRRRVESLAQALSSFSKEDREKLREAIEHLEMVIRIL